MTVALHYRCGEADVWIPVELQATYPNLGGRRWWFTSPMIVGGVTCGRRVGKLYFPHGARYFGCRHCHGLAYRSSQEAHQWERWERVCVWLARQKGMDDEVGKSLASRFAGKRVK